MNEETLIKANKLNDRVKKLFEMKFDLRPGFCNGVGVYTITKKNDSTIYYKYNMWTRYRNNKGDMDLIMKEGIQAMYNKVCSLLEEAERDLKEL